MPREGAPGPASASRSCAMRGQRNAEALDSCSRSVPAVPIRQVQRMRKDWSEQMLKTRERTRPATPGEAQGQRCRMCGTTVAVGSDGRCRLGHHVGLPTAPMPAAASLQAADPQVEAPLPAAPRAAAPPAAAWQVETPRTEAPRLELPAPPPPAIPAPAAAAAPAVHAAAAAGPAAPATDLYEHPYDDVLSWEPAAAPAPDRASPAPAARPAAHPDLSSALDELLAWDEPAPVSALDVHIDELPAPPPPLSEPPVPARTEFVDEDAEVAEEETSRRRVAALLGGGAAAMVAGFLAAVLVFPM